MSEGREPLINRHLFGAGVRVERDTTSGLSESEVIDERRRMRIALEAAEALERAIAEGLVGVVFAALWDRGTDPLDLELEISVGTGTDIDDRLYPRFTFNLRDVYDGTAEDGGEALERVGRILPVLEQLVERMRADLRSAFHAIEPEDNEPFEDDVPDDQ